MTSIASPAGRSSTPSGRASRSTRCSTRSRPTPPSCSPSATAATRPTCPSRTSPAAKPGRVRLRRRTARPRARRPRASARPAPLLLEERKVGARPRAARGRRARLLGDLRLPPVRRPVAGAAVLGRLSWQLATSSRRSPRRRRACVRSCSTSTAGPATAPASTSTCGSPPRTATGPSARYSIASAPGEPPAITVERLDDGEVSPYLTARSRAGRRLRGPRPDRRLLRLGARIRRPALPRRRRLGHRAAPRDAAPPPRSGERRPRAPALLGAHARRRDLPRGARAADRRRRGRLHADPRRSRPAGPATHDASTPSCCARSRGRRAGPLAFVCGPTSFVEAVASGSSSSATRRRASRPSGSAQREGDDGALDGNAIGGVLHDVFAAEMTVATGAARIAAHWRGRRVRGLSRRAGRDRPLPELPRMLLMVVRGGPGRGCVDCSGLTRLEPVRCR